MLDLCESTLCAVMSFVFAGPVHFPHILLSFSLFCVAKAAGTISFIFSLSLLTVRFYKAVSFSLVDFDLFGLGVRSFL